MCDIKNTNLLSFSPVIVFDSHRRDESLHQSYRDEQSDCWHWQGEVFLWPMKSAFSIRLPPSLFLSCDSHTNTRLNLWKSGNTQWKVCCVVFIREVGGTEFLANACVCPLQGHRAHVLDFDAVWNEGASPKDIYESTTKAFILLLSSLLHKIVYLALIVYKIYLFMIFLRLTF